MIDVPLSLVSASDRSEAPPSVSAVIETLADALRGRNVPPRQALAAGETASSDEGLVLLKGFLDVRDPDTRQAILDVVATLASERW